MHLFYFVSFIAYNFDKYLYLILFALLFIEEAGVPLPVTGDIYIFLAGYQVLAHKANPIFIILDTTTASLLGASLLFLLVQKKGEPLVEKYGKYIRLSPARLDRAKAWFSKHGEAVILIGRWIPGLRIVMTVVGALLNLEYYKFAIAMVISTAVWGSAFLAAGVIFARQKQRIIAFIDVFKHIPITTTYELYFLIILLFLLSSYLILYRRARKGNAD